MLGNTWFSLYVVLPFPEIESEEVEQKYIIGGVSRECLKWNRLESVGIFILFFLDLVLFLFIHSDHLGKICHLGGLSHILYCKQKTTGTFCCMSRLCPYIYLHLVPRTRPDKPYTVNMEDVLFGCGRANRCLIQRPSMRFLAVGRGPGRMFNTESRLWTWIISQWFTTVI